VIWILALLIAPLSAQILPIGARIVFFSPPITLLSSTKCQAGVDVGNGAGKSANWDTTGATLIVAGSVFNGGGNPAPTDNHNTYTNAINSSADADSNHASLWYVSSPTTNAAEVGSCAGGSFHTVYFLAFSNTNASSPLDQTSSNTTASGSSLASALTPSQNNTVVFTCLEQQQTSGTFSIDSGFTISQQSNNNVTTAAGGGCAYKVQTTAAAVTPLWSWSTGATAAAAATASFKAP